MLALETLLDRSLADEAFKADVRAYAHHQRCDRIVVLRHAPRVKVLRVLAQLLAAEPTLRVERLRIDGASGCCDFRGTVVAEAGGVEHAFAFAWDCRWRAEVEGWVDRWGSPDQSRAAREFGWRCFSLWARLDGAVPREAADAARAAG